MPWINENKHPSGSGGPAGRPLPGGHVPPQSKPNVHQDNSLKKISPVHQPGSPYSLPHSHQEHSVIANKMERYLKSPAGRQELAKEFGISSNKIYSPQMEKTIEAVMENAQHMGVVIESEEAEHLMKPSELSKAQFEEKHLREKIMQDRVVTSEERQEAARLEKKTPVFWKIWKKLSQQ
jgi:hypothetical protein